MAEQKKTYSSPEVKVMDVAETRTLGGPDSETVAPGQTAAGMPS